MSGLFRYGVIKYEGARPGDVVRFIPGPRVGQPGEISRARSPHEKNAVLRSVKGEVGYCQLKPQLQSSRASAEGGSASGIQVNLPVTAGGSLRFD